MKTGWTLTVVFLLSLLCCQPLLLSAQSPQQEDQPLDISGQWIGTVTQNEGGFRSVYELQMFFYQQGDSITGRSYVTIKDVDIFVDFEINGSIHSDILLRLSDVRKLDFKVKEGMEWCDKKYQLVIKRDGNDLTIEGYWQGKTTFSSCVPGRVYLRKFSPRA